jgi:hypothetical protein
MRIQKFKKNTSRVHLATIYIYIYLNHTTTTNNNNNNTNNNLLQKPSCTSRTIRSILSCCLTENMSDTAPNLCGQRGRGAAMPNDSRLGPGRWRIFKKKELKETRVVVYAVKGGRGTTRGTQSGARIFFLFLHQMQTLAFGVDIPQEFPARWDNRAPCHPVAKTQAANQA